MRIRKDAVRSAAILRLAVGLLGGAEVVSAQIPCGGYEVTAIIQVDECPPFGFPPTLPDGMNDLGAVVGHFNSCVIGPAVAFLWTPKEGLQILPMPKGTSESYAHDLNNSPRSQIVGEFNISGDGLGAFGFLLDGKDFIEIRFPGATFTNAAALNDRRQVVGSTADDSPYSKAYIWEDGIMTIIEPTFGPRSSGRDINEAGAVVGWMGTSIGIDSHAFLWEDGRVQDVGIIPGGLNGAATAINANRKITVTGIFNDDHPKGFISGGFLWEAGQWTDLGMLPGYDSMALTGLNDSDRVAGWSRALESSDLPDAGFIWQDGVMTNLNDLIPQGSGLWIARPEAINNAGQIVGFGEDENGDVVGFVLTPMEARLGDLDGDCQVGASDLLLLLSSWGPCDDCGKCPADFNADCTVGAFDLLVLLTNWG